ncbi:MAG: hypothetical protein V2I43_15470 [Parvularcula sp.]|jgi:hypothetical protein|nr:hypothetical protein [Parvularcula sp.]
MRFHAVGALALTLVLASAPAYALDWKDSYRAYAEAMQTGDRDAAVRHAREAWEGAQSALPPSENRALLAQNYANLILLGDASAATAPLEDAEAMGEAGFGLASQPLPVTRFYLAMARSEAEPRNRRLVGAARKAFDQVPEGTGYLNELVTLGTRLGLRLIEIGDPQDAQSLSRNLIARLHQSGEPDPARLLDLEGLALVGAVKSRPIQPSDRKPTNLRSADSGTDRFVQQLRESFAGFEKIRDLIPNPRSIDDFDPREAQALAWQAIVRSYLLRYTGEKEGGYDQEPIGLSSDRCPELTWLNDPLRIPRGNSGFNGGVIAGFHIDDEGRVYGERILAEVPQEQFSPFMLDQIGRIKVDLASAPEGCRRDRVLTVTIYHDF